MDCLAKSFHVVLAYYYKCYKPIRRNLHDKSRVGARIAEKAKLTKAQAESAFAVFQCAVTEELVNGGKITLIGFARSHQLRELHVPAETRRPESR
jgi:hypothetical protein